MDGEALLLTLQLAMATTVVLLAIALPLAWWLSLGGGWARAGARALVTLPLLLPPTVLGFYLLVALGPLTAAGRLLTRVLGHPLAFSFAGLLVGSVVYSLPFAVQPLATGFERIGREFAESAAVLGDSPLRVFRRVLLPLAAGDLVTAAVLVFLHTVGEFGVVLMIGGNIPGSTRTLSISLYNLIEDGRYTEANRTALLLVALALAGLSVLYARRRRVLG